jgi:predicted ester cyclase
LTERKTSNEVNMNRMNLYPLILGAVFILVLSSCSQNSAVRHLEEQNIALIKRIHSEISNGNIAIFDEVLAPDYVRHCQAMPPELWEINDNSVFKAFVADFLKAVPDCNDEIEFIIADSNMVTYVTTTTGTQTGPMGDLPPSGKKFMLKNIVIQRIEDGKVAETWISWDNVALLTQLGFFPPPSAEKP